MTILAGGSDLQLATSPCLIGQEGTSELVSHRTPDTLKRTVGARRRDGSYEVDVGTPEAEEEDERKLGVASLGGGGGCVDEEGKEEAQEEARGKGNTSHLSFPLQTLTVPVSSPLAQVLMEVDEETKSDEEDLPRSDRSLKGGPRSMTMSSPYPYTQPKILPAYARPTVCLGTSLELKPAVTKGKKRAPRQAKTTTIAPKTSKPSRRRRDADTPTNDLRAAPAPSLSSRAPADFEINSPMPTPAALECTLYQGITFERCVDISLSAVPYLFGDACAFQFCGVSGSGSLGLELGTTDATALDGDEYCSLGVSPSTMRALLAILRTSGPSGLERFSLGQGKDACTGQATILLPSGRRVRLRPRRVEGGVEWMGGGVVHGARWTTDGRFCFWLCARAVASSLAFNRAFESSSALSFPVLMLATSRPFRLDLVSSDQTDSRSLARRYSFFVIIAEICPLPPKFSRRILESGGTLSLLLLNLFGFAQAPLYPKSPLSLPVFRVSQFQLSQIPLRRTISIASQARSNNSMQRTRFGLISISRRESGNGTAVYSFFKPSIAVV
ncbi:hypothetical protein DFP72DRAFT_1052465 [Ephemerocybe angulata]|uniref:Uncharacterized protein n=1 Tax=Ephemerocybe angulata TaxID=980116 RepID=A0A8H6LVP7_9AGAR|nr:hypothetical protein DFP72DRAFT_1052465 [Tulosesus angulatus]